MFDSHGLEAGLTKERKAREELVSLHVCVLDSAAGGPLLEDALGRCCVRLSSLNAQLIAAGICVCCGLCCSGLISRRCVRSLLCPLECIEGGTIDSSWKTKFESMQLAIFSSLIGAGM